MQEIMKKNNIWNIRRLVNEAIVPANPVYHIEDCQILNAYVSFYCTFAWWKKVDVWSFSR